VVVEVLDYDYDLLLVLLLCWHFCTYEDVCHHLESVSDVGIEDDADYEEAQDDEAVVVMLPK
jgi:hypothetical protein